jgi:hypothetical protein
VGSWFFGTEMISYMADLCFSTAINILDLFGLKWVNIYDVEIAIVVTNFFPFKKVLLIRRLVLLQTNSAVGSRENHCDYVN